MRKKLTSSFDKPFSQFYSDFEKERLKGISENHLIQTSVQIRAKSEEAAHGLGQSI